MKVTWLMVNCGNDTGLHYDGSGNNDRYYNES